MVDSMGEPIRVAAAPWLKTSLDVVDRYVGLLVPAIEEALAAVPALPGTDRVRIGLALGLPPVRPGRPRELTHGVVRALADRFGRRFTKIVTFECGHAAGYLALEAEMRGLAAATMDSCVVAGVDSYVDPATLEWIEENDQLHGAGALNNAWGFIPGEAGAALLLSTAEWADKYSIEPLGIVIGLGIGRETKLIKTETVCIGEGLTAAFRAALGSLPQGEEVHNVFCDLNGETYRADEYGLTAVRVKDRFRAATDFVAPADCWGDVGAAGAPLHILLGLIAHRKGYAKGPVSLVCASSESGERGAAVILALSPRERSSCP
jgi:3-oxoacyl-[acyl-carrier-protein] synthase-1